MSFSNPCQDSKSKIVCELKWNAPNGEPNGIQLIEEPCGLDEDAKISCMVLRSCYPNRPGDKGATIFRSDVSPRSFCLSGKEMEVFAPTFKNSPLAFITCEGKERPNGLRLSSSDKKHTKICSFPYKAIK